MKINIVLQDLQAEFPHLIDKQRFEVVETKEPGTWIVRKREVVLGTETTQSIELNKTVWAGTPSSN